MISIKPTTTIVRFLSILHALENDKIKFLDLSTATTATEMNLRDPRDTLETKMYAIYKMWRRKVNETNSHKLLDYFDDKRLDDDHQRWAYDVKDLWLYPENFSGDNLMAFVCDLIIYDTFLNYSIISKIFPDRSLFAHSLFDSQEIKNFLIDRFWKFITWTDWNRASCQSAGCWCLTPCFSIVSVLTLFFLSTRILRFNLLSQIIHNGREMIFECSWSRQKKFWWQFIASNNFHTGTIVRLESRCSIAISFIDDNFLN